MTSPTYGADIFYVKTGTALPDGSEPAIYYVPVGGETRVTMPNMNLASGNAVGIPAKQAPTVIYRKEPDGSFLVPPASVAQFTAVVSKRI
jgi:hypothetical protein